MIAFRLWRPMRPKPLIPTRTVIECPLRFHRYGSLPLWIADSLDNHRMAARQAHVPTEFGRVYGNSPSWNLEAIVADLP